MADSTVDILLRARMEASDVESSINQIQKSLKGLTIPKGIADNLDKDFSKLSTLLKDYQKQLNKGFSNKKDLQNFQALREELQDTFGSLDSNIKQINSKDIRLKVDTDAINKLEKQIATIEERLTKAKDTISQSLLNKGITDALNNIGQNAGRATTITKMSSAASIAFNNQDFEAYNQALDKLRDKILNLGQINKINIAKALGIDTTKKSLEEINEAIINTFGNLEVKAGKVQNINNLESELKQLGVDLQDLSFQAIDRGKESLEQTVDVIPSLANGLQQTGDAAEDAGESLVKMTSEVDSLKKSTEYFFGLRNMLNLLKRGIRQAISTVEELDKVMTETAVVTTYSVGDMWAKLPLYTDQANQLGSTIKDVYEATTLYYQQGLDTDQAIGLANETLKMARIAGMEAAEATDAMTAALRGFNMEINGVSAQRINDVYSKIAATTASNTEELSTAMTKTASLAHSAGMSFEGTTAFLAQMIETTREAPENLGTAMKTIIARFQEMKKNPLEIVNVEGEEVSYNKIDEALQSIGVNLKDVNGQFRNLDEVFLEISSKWDSLTQTQQRYIATTAAGSRQQSRFIAMMSNYDRVTQLVEYANNSAGASQEQFGKTLESFEAKVNKLKNAWQEFLMGIADNTIIKTSIDLLTKGLSQVNKVIDTLSGKSGILQSILSLFIAGTGLKAGGKLVNAAIGGAAGFIDPKSSFFKGFFGGGASGKMSERNIAQAEAISNPIVGKLSEILNAVNGIKNTPDNINNNLKNNPLETNAKNIYKDSFKNLPQAKNLNTAFGYFEGLDNKQQRSLFNNRGGTQMRMKKAANDWLINVIPDEALQKTGLKIQNEIFEGMKNGTVEPSKGGKFLNDILNWDQYDVSDEAKELSKTLKQKIRDNALANPDIDESKLADPKIQKRFEEEYNKLAGKYQTFGYQQLPESKDLTGLADKVGAVGSAFTQTGYAISSFGSVLKQVGGPIGTVGSLLEGLGNTVASLGMGISGLATTLPKLAGMVGGALPLVGIIAAITAIGAGIFLWQKHLKDVREAAEQVTKTFEETNKTTSDNIADLKQYKDELATLSKGVDENGYNINLSVTDYDKYLEIVDRIAEINPDIVEGYNAQGHAIINNNKALQETLDLQEQIQQEALNDYISSDSLEKLLDARAIDKTYTSHFLSDNISNGRDRSSNSRHGRGQSSQSYGGYTTESIPKVALSKEVANVVKTLQRNGFDESILKNYGINSFDDLAKGDAAAVKAFVKNQKKILKDAEYQLTDSWDKIGDSVTKTFDELGTATDEVKAANQPIFQQVSTWASNQGLYEEIPNEYRGLLSEGIYDIINTEDISSNEIRKQTRNLVKQLNNEFGPSSRYAKVMEDAAAIKDEFVKGLSKTKYQANIEPLIDQLEQLQEAAKKKGGAAGEALYNAYAKEIDNLINFTENGAVNMMEALNPLSDEIAAAEGAFGQFQEATSSDFSTAAKNMKQFFDVLDDEEHNAGYGDKSFWMAAENLFGTKALEGITTPHGLDAMKETLSSMFEDGTKGYNNFVDYLSGLEGDLKRNNSKVWDMLFDENGIHLEFDDENIPEIAEALGMSENTFTALLNKARQFAHISFTNVEDLKTALATSDTTVFGKNADANGQKSLYVSETQLKNDARDAGIANTPDEWKQFWEDIKNQGIITIPEPGKLSDSLIKTIKDDLEIQNVDDIVSNFAKMGFGKEDIIKYAQKILPTLNQKFDAEKFNTAYEDYLATENIDPALAESNQHLNELVSLTTAIKNYLSTDDVQNGYLTEENARSEKSREAVYGKEGKEDSLLDYFRKGLDTNGQALSQENYETYLNALNHTIGEQKEYLGQLEQGLKDNVDTMDPQTKALYEDEIAATKELISTMESDIALGTRNFEIFSEKGKNPYESQTAQPQATETTQTVTVDTKIHAKVDGDITVQKQRVEAELADLKKDAAELEKQLENPTKFGLDEESYETAREKLDIINGRIISINQELNALNNKQINIHYSATGNIKPGGLIQENLYKGKNNYISPSGFYTGSAAKGSKGTLGPNGKGGLTLTGEKGFEIAWLPSENRSMILGAHGPQMADLPADAVVWDHEQSKKIIKQQGISIGSMAPGNDVNGILTKWNDPIDVNIVNDETSSSGSGSGSSSGSSSDKEKDPKHTNWYKEEITRFNLNQSINKITAEIEKVTKSIEKSLDKLGTKYSNIAKNVETQAKLINQNIANQKALQKSYQDQINLLDKGGRSLWMDIIDSAGESSQKSISTGQFVYKQADGSYAVDKNKVLSYAASLGGDAETQKVNAETIFNTINSELNNLTSGLLSATKAIEDGKEELQNLIKQVQDAFYAWENELTKIYDLNQQLENSDIRRNRLASENSMLLAQISAGFNSAADAAERLQAIERDDAKLIRERISLLKDDIKAKQEQLKQLASSADEESDWAKYNWNNQQTLKAGGTLSINDIAQEQQAADKYLAARYIEAFTKITRNADNSITLDFNEEALENERLNGNISEATYNAIKEGFDALQEANEDLQQTIIDASDFMTELYEEYNKHIQTLAELEKDLIDAFVEAAQREVNKLEALNSALTNAAKAVLDQVKKNIDARRKSEDNAKTEGDIAQKQARLAVLRANTGGGNQVEIAQLEKEISDAQRSYGRTLEDQLMANMQSQADEASKQRQEQIDLAKQQIEYNKQIGLYASMADDLLKDGNLNIVAIEETLKITRQDGIGYYNEILEGTKLQSQIAEAVSASQGLDELADILGVTGDDVKSIGEELAKLITTWNTQMMKQEEVISTGTGGSSSVKSPTVSSNPEPKTSTNSSSNSKSSTTKKDYSSGWLATLPETNSNYFSSAQVKTLQHGLNTMKWSGLISFGADLAIDGVIGSKTTTAIKALQKLVGTTQDGIWGPQTGAATHKKYPKYAHGGLANKTGPAWLDGTPTKPELVLNAQDTKNFIALKDILSGVMRSISHTDTSNIYNSPTNFEINVNVEKIASDYDVDKLTERIKRNIVKDATYRNVTSVRKFK